MNTLQDTVTVPAFIVYLIVAIRCAYCFTCIHKPESIKYIKHRYGNKVRISFAKRALVYCLALLISVFIDWKYMSLLILANWVISETFIYGYKFYKLDQQP